MHSLGNIIGFHCIFYRKHASVHKIIGIDLFAIIHYMDSTFNVLARIIIL